MSVIVSGSVTVSGSTEVGYRLNTRNLLLAYDAGSDDSFPPPPNATIYDLSGNLNNTVLTAPVVYENISSSFYFPTLNPGIPFTASELSTADFATFEVVFQFSGSVAGGTFKIIFGFNQYVLIQAASAINFGNLTGNYISPSGFTADTNWKHIVVQMYSGSLNPTGSNKMWINGVQQSLTSDMTPADLPSLNFNGGIGVIGNNTLGSVPMQGYISVFKIYKRALSQQEITENYNFYKSRYPIP